MALSEQHWAYCNVYLWESVTSLFTGGALPWAKSAEVAGKHFFSDLLGFDNSFSLGPPMGVVLIGTIVSWLMIYFCLFKGVKWVSKVVLITVPLPWLMLVILAMRGLTMDGAQTGLHFYLEPTWGQLANADTWRAAFGQVFFSLSLGFAVMLAYASFLHRKSDINNNAAIIGLGDLATSFIAGIAVFAILGGMAQATNQETTAVVKDGIGLAFIAFPYALSTLGQAATVFSMIFFIALITLGIDSAFSIVEAVQASVNDNKRKTWRAHWTLPTICTVGLLISIVFTCSRGGLSWLGLTDDLINGPFGILAVAFAECAIVGYAWKGRFLKAMRQHANERSDWKIGPWWDAIIRYIAPTLLLALIVWSMSDWVADDKWEQVIGVGVFVLIPLVALLVTRTTPEDPAVDTPDHGGRVWPILVLPLAAAVLGLGIGLVRLGPARNLRARDAVVTQQARVAQIEAALAQGEGIDPVVKHDVGLELIAYHRVLPTALDQAGLTAVHAQDEPRPVHRQVVAATSATYGNLEKVVDDTVKRELAHSARTLKEQGGDPLDATSALKLALKTVAGPVKPFTPKQLGSTAYIILAVAFVIIFGGLAWCFWKALQAAGRQDAPLEAEEETGKDEGPPDPGV